MKKIVVLVGFAAAIYGAKKILSSKGERASEPFGANGYSPAPQG